jgi:AraC-like DNA-binding protein
MYRERPSTIPGAVVWTRRVGNEPRPARIVPDGCLDLIWLNGELVVAGPDTGPQFSVSPARARLTGLRFPPGTGPSVLGVPAHELRDQRIRLLDLWPAARVRELTERVGESDAPGLILESAARGPVEPDRTVRGIAATLSAGVTVAGTAAVVGLSERQLHRRCLDSFGYGPKLLARVLRFDRALRAARSGTPFAAVAAQTGYADQAHLAREVKTLAGVPLGELLR